eukprot:6397821-Alexandrium_andersonii.AAC.1
MGRGAGARGWLSVGCPWLVALWHGQRGAGGAATWAASVAAPRGPLGAAGLLPAVRGRGWHQPLA